jgi:hypothetical protein
MSKRLMAQRLAVRAIVALLLHCQPAIADLFAPPHVRLETGRQHVAFRGADGLEKAAAFKGR